MGGGSASGGRPTAQAYSVEGYERIMITGAACRTQARTRFSENIRTPSGSESLIFGKCAGRRASHGARTWSSCMLAKRPDVRAVMVGRKARIVIMAQKEITDLPSIGRQKAGQGSYQLSAGA